MSDTMNDDSHSTGVGMRHCSHEKTGVYFREWDGCVGHCPVARVLDACSAYATGDPNGRDV